MSEVIVLSPPDELDESLTLLPLSHAARAALDVLCKHDAPARIQEQRATIAGLHRDLLEYEQIILKKNETIAILKETIALYEACYGLTVADAWRSGDPGDEPLLAHIVRLQKQLRTRGQESERDATL